MQRDKVKLFYFLIIQFLIAKQIALKNILP